MNYCWIFFSEHAGYPGKVLSLENISDDIKKNNDIINYFYFTKIGSIYDDYELILQASNEL